MKLTNKARQAIKDAIWDAHTFVVSDHVAQCLDTPPDLWSDYDRRIYDLISQVCDKVEENVGKRFDQS